MVINWLHRPANLPPTAVVRQERSPMTSAVDPNSTANPPLVGPRQMDILRLLWQHGPATVRELRDRLVTDPPLSYTTILTICVRLAEKGLAERQRAEPSDESRSANAYIYTPRCS